MTDLLRTNTRMRFILGLLLACLGFAPLDAPCAGSENPVNPQGVQIHVQHGVQLPWGKPGFRIEVSGWQPNGELALYAIAPDGTKLALILEEKPAHADEHGEFSVDIDYQRKGLIQGHWMFLMAGKPGVHEFEADLPRVEPPTDSRQKWRLIFRKEEGKTM